MKRKHRSYKEKFNCESAKTASIITKSLVMCLPKDKHEQEIFYETRDVLCLEIKRHHF